VYSEFMGNGECTGSAAVGKSSSIDGELERVLWGGNKKNQAGGGGRHVSKSIGKIGKKCIKRERVVGRWKVRAGSRQKREKT